MKSAGEGAHKVPVTEWAWYWEEPDGLLLEYDPRLMQANGVLKIHWKQLEDSLRRAAHADL